VESVDSLWIPDPKEVGQVSKKKKDEKKTELDFLVFKIYSN